MSQAKCNRCGGTSEGSSFEEASSKIDHAVGLSRGIKCGNNYGQVVELNPPTKITNKKPKKEKLESEPVKE